MIQIHLRVDFLFLHVESGAGFGVLSIEILIQKFEITGDANHGRIVGCEFKFWH